MKLIGAGGLDLAVLPIGDRFTMGPDDAVEAVKLLKPKRVAAVPLQHLAADRAGRGAWAERVRAETKAEPIVLEPWRHIAITVRSDHGRRRSTDADIA